MTITQMLQQSGLLTVLGMGIVFVFLAIMIILMHILHGMVHALHLDKDVCSGPEETGASDKTNNETVAAVAAAVHIIKEV